MSTSTVLTANITADLIAVLLASEAHGNAQYPAYLRTSYSLGNGVSSYQANAIWSITATASSVDTYDLTDLTDVFGDAISFTSLKGIYFKASTQNTGNLTLDIADMTAVLPPAGIWLFAAPVTGSTVVSSPPDVATVTGTGTYDLMFVGVSTSAT